MVECPVNRFVIKRLTFVRAATPVRPLCSETHRQSGLQSMPRLKVMLNERIAPQSLSPLGEDAPCATSARGQRDNRADGAVQLNESLG